MDVSEAADAGAGTSLKQDLVGWLTTELSPSLLDA